MPATSAITGAVAGVVVLGGVVAFAVGLPEVTGEPASAEQGEADRPPVADLLPASLLDGALVRFSEVDPRYAELDEQVSTYSSEKITEAFGTDTAVGLYATADVQSQVGLTIYDGESGLFLQNGPPVPPEMSAGSQTQTDIQQVGDAVCIGQWSTQALQQSPDAPPFQTQCQQVADGRTFNVYASGGLSVEQTVEILDDAVAQAEQ